MNNIIQIQQTTLGGAEINAVNAREIHEFLGVKTEFRHWIKRAIEKYDFIENIDFISTTVKNDRSEFSGLQARKDYIVTLDMAKELAMTENNFKGKEVRKYFIECEKKLRESFQVPKTYAEALYLAAKQAEQLELQNKQLIEQKPKVEAFGDLMDCKNNYTMSQVGNVVGVGRNTLFQILREHKILKHDNTPYQAYINLGCFDVIVKPIKDLNISKTQTVVTQKGLEYIRKMLKGIQ